MLRSEFTKLMSKLSTKILLCFMTVMLIVMSLYSIFSTHYVLEDGINTLNGIQAIQKTKEEKSKWNGILNEDKIEKVINENSNINSIYDPYSQDIVELQKGYSKKQSFMDIRDMLTSSFCNFRDYDYYIVDRLSLEDADKFYANRKENLENWMNNEGKGYYSQQEADYYTQKYEEMPEPLTYSYQDGWNKLFSTSTSLLQFTVIIISLIVASIFSQEFTTKSYSILFSTKYGRSKAIKSKLICGTIVSVALYTFVVGSYSLIILGIYGFDGYNCLIQSNNVMGWAGWKSIYYITNLEAYSLIFGSGLVGTLFTTYLTMFVSYLSKSTVFASIIAFLLIIIPNWIAGFIDIPVLNTFLNLLPDQLMMTSRNLLLFNMLTIGNIFISPIVLMIITYLVLGVLLSIIILKISRKMYSE